MCAAPGSPDHPLPRVAVLLALLLAAACVPPRPATVPAGPIALALITWNLDGGRGDAARLADDLSSGRLTDGPVADYVLLLQEATEGADRDVAAFARARALDVFFAPVRRGPARTSGNAIVSTRPLADTRVVALPRERQPRAAVAASVDVAGERLFLVSVHLENRVSWWRFGLFADNARGRQADALIAALPAGHGIVGGDMNTMLGVREPAWRALLQRFPDTPPETHVPTFGERLVLDHLFFDVPDGWSVARDVIADRYGSDHHPVLGVIRARRESESTEF